MRAPAVTHCRASGPTLTAVRVDDHRVAGCGSDLDRGQHVVGRASVDADRNDRWRIRSQRKRHAGFAHQAHECFGFIHIGNDF